MLKILITGVNGFLGRAIAEHFQEQGWQVLGLARRLIHDALWPIELTSYDVSDLSRIVARYQPDVIFHGAGSAMVQLSMAKPDIDFYPSVMLFQHLLESVRDSGLKPRVFYPSSAAVYGNPVRLPVREDSPQEPISPYGYNRLICELMAKEYASVFLIPVTVLRLFSLFGFHQRKLLIWEVFWQIMHKEAVSLQGTGLESRDYLPVEAFAGGVESLARKTLSIFEVVNIASGRSLCINEVVEIVREHLGSTKPVFYAAKGRSGDPVDWVADMSRYVSLAGKSLDVDVQNSLCQLLDVWQATSFD